MSAATPAADEGGFTLIEIVIAMTLLSITILSLTGLTLQVARRALDSQGVVKTTAAVAEQVGRLTMVPFETLSAEEGCTAVTGDFPHERCITVFQVSAKKKKIQLIVTPVNAAFSPDTVEFDRGQGAKGNPFNTD